MRDATGHSPSMAMTRRRFGRDCTDSDMHAPHEHRRDFIGGTARRSPPNNRFRSMTRAEKKSDRMHDATTYSNPRKRCRPHWAAGKVRHGRA
ncbi:hypothetical protein [Rhodanobacter sp. Soil772]|uniref:hypothetical protein n=1 Tax=Rhodanobacter sp. Soil772 TaxID=1736406 RepID=UPI00138F30EC|nr:hypothetical protein [Rhodanobacter sp. Soil772]